MNRQKIFFVSTKIYITLCILSIGYVSILSLISPQSTMDMVNMKLPNPDAISSIRGIYGGMGLAITIGLVYLMLKHHRMALIFLALSWGLYAVSRIITHFVDGALGDFGSQWLLTESVLCALALILLTFLQKTNSNKNAKQ